MSTADTLNSIREHIGDAYTELGRLGIDLTGVNKNIQNIGVKLNTGLTLVTEVKGEGSNVSLSPTSKGGLRLIPLGNCEQDSYSGKNQLPPTENFTSTTSGVTIKGEGGIYNYSGSNVSGAKLVDKDITNQYTIKENDYLHVKNDVIDANCTFNFVFSDNTSTNLQSFNVLDKKYSLSSYVGKTITKVRLYAGANYTGTLLTITPMILNNVSTTSDWEQYVGGMPSPNPDYPQDIRVVTGDNEFLVQNKNLCPSAFQDNINILGSGNNRVVETYAYKKCQVIKVKPNTTYILSGTFTTSFGDNIGRVCMFNEYPIVNSVSTKVVTGNPNLTFTTEANTKYIVLLSAKANTNIEAPDLQLEAGSTATSYVEGKSQTLPLHLGTNYLAGIGDYKDEIVGKTDEWKIKRYVGKVICTGASGEGWNIFSISETKSQFYRTFDNALYDASIITAISNYFKGDLSFNRYTKDNIIYSLSNSIGIATTKVLSVADFKTWLSTHNTIVYYELETPTEETITDQTLVADLNNMYQASGYDGVVNITTISDSNNARLIVSAATTNTNSDFSDEYMIIRKEAVPQENVAKVLENNY